MLVGSAGFFSLIITKQRSRFWSAGVLPEVSVGKFTSRVIQVVGRIQFPTDEGLGFPSPCYLSASSHS